MKMPTFEQFIRIWLAFLVGWFVLVAVLLAISSARAGESTMQRDAPTQRFYDSRGNVTGSASTYGNQTKFYDARGNHTGTATSNGSIK